MKKSAGAGWPAEGCRREGEVAHLRASYWQDVATTLDKEIEA